MAYGRGRYLVTSIDGAGNPSLFKLGVGATTPAPTPPPDPAPPGSTVPDKVKAVTVTPGNGKLDIEWIAPDYMGGANPLGYLVKIEPGAIVIDLPDPNARTTSRSGLTNGVLHTISVQARNARGLSLPFTVQSSPTSGVVIVPPPPPPGGIITHGSQVGAWNTGPPAGRFLTSSTRASYEIAGEVITDMDINATVTTRAERMVFRNCKIRGGLQVGAGGVLPLFEDCEIISGRNAAQYGGYTLRRCNVHSQTQDCCKLGSDTLIEDSYLHDLLPEPGAHADCTQAQDAITGPVTVRRCHIDSRNASGGLGNSAAIIKWDLLQGGSANWPIIFDDNLVGGGNYTVYVLSGYTGLVYPDVRVRGNVFKRSSWRYGPAWVNIPCIWENNTFQDNGAPVGPIRTGL